MCDGPVSQQPPIIVAPAFLKFFAISAIFLGVRSSLFPRNSLGFVFF